MSASQQTPKDRDVRDYLAAEQTFLGWIRTGLAFMGFGFVVARFGLFLQQLALVEPALKIGHHGISIWFGTVMMLMGVGMNVFPRGTMFVWSVNSIRARHSSRSRQRRLS